MSALSKVRQRLRSKAYREAFVASQLKRGLPMQIRVLLKNRNWTQSDLAQRAGLKQGVVSRAADPDYGNLTLKTILKIAAGFDVAYVGRFVPFSELARWYTDLSESALSVPSFNDEAGATKGSVAPDVRVKEESANGSSRLIPAAAGLAGCGNSGVYEKISQPNQRCFD
jgi:transcriptional regulator with XRE-family HTH domain